MNLRWSFTLAAALSACGPGNTFSGTINGDKFVPADAVYVVIPATGSYPETMGVMISSAPNLCQVMQASALTKNTTYLGLNLYATASANIGPGTFEINDDNTAAFFASDTNCNPTTSAVGTSGSMVVSSYSANSTVDGTFTLNFDSDATSGHFAANYCAAMALWATKLLSDAFICQ